MHDSFFLIDIYHLVFHVVLFMLMIIIFYSPGWTTGKSNDKSLSTTLTSRIKVAYIEPHTPGFQPGAEQGELREARTLVGSNTILYSPFS